MLLRLCNEFFCFLSIKHLEGLEERAIAPFSETHSKDIYGLNEAWHFKKAVCRRTPPQRRSSHVPEEMTSIRIVFS